MTVIYRDTDWFLFYHGNGHFVHAKCSITPLLLHIKRTIPKCVLGLTKIVSSDDQTCVFRVQSIKEQWITMWSKASYSDKQWLLYEFIDICLQCGYVPDIKQIWYLQTGEFCHTDWKRLQDNRTLTKLTFHTNLNDSLKKLFNDIKDRTFDSAPWSLHSFMKSVRDNTQTLTNTIIHSAWWIRQELSNKKTRGTSFSLTDGALPLEPRTVKEQSKEMSSDSSDEEQNDDKDTHAHTFPVIRGSVLRSPVIKSYDNHITSRRNSKETTIISKFIRLSSSLLK